MSCGGTPAIRRKISPKTTLTSSVPPEQLNVVTVTDPALPSPFSQITFSANTPVSSLSRAPRRQLAQKSASRWQPQYATHVMSNAESESEKRPAKRVKKDSDSDYEDSAEDKDEPPKQHGRPPKSSPLTEMLALHRKSARLLKAIDADLEQLQQKDTQIDELKAENARLQQGWNESKRSTGNLTHQMLEMRKTVEELTKKLEECGKTEIGLKSELAQAKECLRKAEHTLEVKARETIELNDAWAKEKEKLEERVRTLEGTMVQSKGEFTKFIDGLKSGLPGLERLLGSIANETS
ncbi:hypothetical protein VNI00_016276 [Paramarasmius palmivorus]|uniref:Uncharacterized protein n=1 Tax=Paramarasmius palmivorus TaxID=297713 RepID=A0AAW0BE98_9AGAR